MLEDLTKVFIDKGFQLGRLISASKGDYIQKYPNHQVVFNSNLYSAEGKIWYGDLDITKESNKLQEIANELQLSIWVLREWNGRYEEDIFPLDKLNSLAVASFKPTNV